MVQISRYAFVLFVVLLTGCAVPLTKPLAPENLGRLKSVRLHVLVPQEGFLVSASAPGVSIALGGGLIPALIDAGIQKSRQKDLTAQVTPMLDQLLGVDVREEFTTVVTREASGLPLPRAAVESGSLLPTRREHEARVGALGPQEGYLTILMHYNFDGTTRVLLTRAQVTLWQPGDVGRTYFAPVMYYGRPIEPQTDLAAAVREQAREAASQTLKLAALGMAGLPPAQSARREKFEIWSGGYKNSLEGDLIASDQRRRMVRHSTTGTLFSIHQ
jgi:hypothetical protein